MVDVPYLHCCAGNKHKMHLQGDDASLAAKALTEVLRFLFMAVTKMEQAHKAIRKLQTHGLHNPALLTDAQLRLDHTELCAEQQNTLQLFKEVSGMNTFSCILFFALRA